MYIEYYTNWKEVFYDIYQVMLWWEDQSQSFMVDLKSLCEAFHENLKIKKMTF